MDTFSRLGLLGPVPADPPSDLRVPIHSNAQYLDANAAIYGQGTLAARPTSTSGTPGIAGRRYYATDNGIEYIDTGTSWVEASRGVKLVASGVVQSTTGLTFTAPYAGPFIIVAQTTAIWNVSVGAAEMLVQFKMDGTQFGMKPQMMGSNQTTRATWPLFLATITLTQGTHTLTAASDVLSSMDGNDRMSAGVLESH